MRGKYIVKSFGRSEKATGLWSFGRKKDQLNGYIWNAFYNGLGRYAFSMAGFLNIWLIDCLLTCFSCRHVPQLSRMTLKFCKFTRQSKGMRDFIENDLVDFSREHPTVAIYAMARRLKSPAVVCEYLNGSYHWQSLHGMTEKKIKLWLNFWATRSGEPIKVFKKSVTSVWPSVQGPWHPFLNQPTECNIMRFPNKERGEFIQRKISATEQLEKMAKDGQLKDILFSEKKS